MSGSFTVEDMCRAGCTSRRGIRFWEEQGLLGHVERSAGNHRSYTADQVRSAKIIAAAQFAGWKLDEIGKMLADYDPEIYSAILSRLAGVATTANTLGQGLPDPLQEVLGHHAAPAQEYDL